MNDIAKVLLIGCFGLGMIILHLYLLEKEKPKGMKVEQKVETPAGIGYIVAIRNVTYVVDVEGSVLCFNKEDVKYCI